MRINRKVLINDFKNAVEDMRKTHSDGTYYWILGRDEYDNDWAIVLGWADGFEEDKSDDYSNGTYRLCAKVAYQPSNSAMQCGYDIDWLMPYNVESGDVDDTEISIYKGDNIRVIIAWLLDCYSAYMN